VDALHVGRILNGGRRKAATAVLQWIVLAAAAGGRRQHAYLLVKGAAAVLSATTPVEEKWHLSHAKKAYLRARSVLVTCEMGLPNPVHLQGGA
jgi:hypothetical protein